MRYYIGIDIGTSSAKSLLINEVGDVIKESSRTYQVLEPKSGWKEIEPKTWMDAVEETIGELLDSIDTKKVEAIGVTGQMHTVVFLDKDGNSIRPALMWNDTRTTDLVNRMKKEVQNIPSISYLSNILSTGSPAVNLLWLKENEPEQFQKINKFLIGPDYIVYCLTGEYQTDYCEASTSSLCDLERGSWSEEMRELCGFPKTIYPKIRGSAEIIGNIKSKWQEKYNLRKEVKVITGTGDNPAAAIATGCFQKKYPVLSLGTSGVLMFPKDKIELNAKGKNILFSFDGKSIMVLVQGVIQSCGSSVSWWMDKILNTGDYDKETGENNTEKLGESSLLFYPHLVGDKTIYANPNLRGGFFGIGTETTRQDMTLAVMEGICFGVRQLTEIMEIPRERLEGLKVTGGGSKNEVWMQILADVLNVKVIQLDGMSGAGYGVALTAAAASLTDISMEQILEHSIKMKKTFSPRPYNVSLYEEKYKKYKRIYKAMQEVFMSKE